MYNVDFFIAYFYVKLEMYKYCIFQECGDLLGFGIFSDK